MEEKKKRFRPTLGQYRAQEKKIQELEESLRISQDNYNHIILEHRALEQKFREYQEQVELLKEGYNKVMVQKEALLHRGLWERIVNKSV